MIKGDIFLEKTVKYTIKNKLVIKLILAIEYLIIFLESLNSVMRIKEPVDMLNTNNFLSKLDNINPYRYFINTVSCTAVGTSGTLQCNLPTPIIFFGCLVLYVAAYIVYKIKYELSLEDVLRIQDGAPLDMELFNKSFSNAEFFLMNWFILGIRLVNSFLFFIIINTIVSSIIGIANSTGDVIDYPLLILAVFFLFFAEMLDYHILNSSSLMFPYKDLKSHFGSGLCKRYDFLLLAMKIIIALQNNLEMVKFNLNFTHTYLNFLIVLVILTYVLLIVSDITNGKVAYVVNMKLNFYRLFFMIFNCVAILFSLFFYDNFKSPVLSIASFIWVLILSIFLTKGLVRINEKNILNDEKMVFLSIYLFKKMNKEVSNYTSIVYQFLMGHKSKCSYLSYHNMEKTAYPQGYKIRDEFNHHCHICSNDDPEGVSIETIVKQIKHNKKTGTHELTQIETEYYKMIKLIMKNSDNDVIGLVYKTNRILANTKGDFYSFVKLYYNLISLKAENQDSIKRFTAIKKALDVTKIHEEVLKSLNDVYDCVKSKDGDLLSLAERLSSRKQEIFKNISFLLSKSSNADNFTIIMLKFIFENLFNDDSLFKNEKNFYDYEDYLSSYFSDSKNIDLLYNYPQMSLKIMKCSHHFIDYHNKHFEELFPFEIINEQKMHVMDMIKKSGSNEFELDCIINNLPSKEYVTKMKLNCVISYSLEMADFFITGKYTLSEEDIIIATEDRLGINIIGISEKLGNFLHLSNSTLKIFQGIGVKVQINEIFKQSNSKGVFMFNLNRYLRYFESLVMEYEKQSHSDELLEVLENFKKAVKKSEQNDLVFKIRQDNVFKNFFFFTVHQPDVLVTKKKKAEKKGEADDESILKAPSIRMESVTGSQSSGGGGSRGFGSMGGSYGGHSGDKESAQEQANNRRLIFLSRLLAIFSVLVIFYCFFLMYNGIADNMKINESFNIKNYYDKVETFYYHTIACLTNSFIALDRTRSNLNGKDIEPEEFIEQLDRIEGVHIKVQDFLMDEIQEKVDIFQANVMDLQLYISTSHYQEEVDKFFFEEPVIYNAMSIVGNEIKTVKTSYTFFEALKISMNNLKQIIPENGKVGVNIIDSNSSRQDYSNIPNVNIDKYQILSYEVLINYTNYLKHLVSAKNKIITFHNENLSYIFDKCFLLSYMLLAIHLILILISFFLIGHLKKIMGFNSRSINNTITKEVNVKLMKRKLNSLANLNKLFFEDPVNLSKKIGKVRTDLNRERRKEEAEKKQKSTSDYLMRSNSMEDDATQVFTVDKEKHLNPLSKLIFIMLSLYYVYSVIFIVLLKNSTNNVNLATGLFEASSRRFNQITNSINLMKVQILTNNTDYELYTDIEGDDGANGGYVMYLHKNIFKDIKSIYDYLDKYSLFSTAQDFLENTFSCDFIYHETADSTLASVKKTYETTRPNLDLYGSLQSICKKLDLISKHDRTLLDEKIIHDNYKQLFTYNQFVGDYEKMKKLISSSLFQEIMVTFEIVFRPYITYFNNKVINVIEQGTFDSFLMLSIIYLGLNILVDFVILLTFHVRIINRIKSINDDLNMLFGILRIY
jgi:hypothetical protein